MLHPKPKVSKGTPSSKSDKFASDCALTCLCNGLHIRTSQNQQRACFIQSRFLSLVEERQRGESNARATQRSDGIDNISNSTSNSRVPGPRPAWDYSWTACWTLFMHVCDSSILLALITASEVSDRGQTVVYC